MKPPTKSPEILTSLEVVPIDEMKENREVLFKEHFSNEERSELADSHIRTAAGYLAIKRGLATICSSVFTESGFGLHKFGLSHDVNGAIQLSKMPDRIRKYSNGQFFISASYTDKNAFGMVVFQGTCHG